MADRFERFKNLLEQSNQEQEVVDERIQEKRQKTEVLLQLELDLREQLTEAWKKVLQLVNDDNQVQVLQSFLKAYDEPEFRTIKHESKKRIVDFIEFEICKWVRSGQTVPEDLVTAYITQVKSELLASSGKLNDLTKEHNKYRDLVEQLQATIQELTERLEAARLSCKQEEERIESERIKLDKEFSFFFRWGNTYNERVQTIADEQKNLENEQRPQLKEIENLLHHHEVELLVARDEYDKVKSNFTNARQQKEDLYHGWCAPLGIQLPDGLPLEMVRVEQGGHWRGWYGSPEEQPISKIRLSYDFEILSTPVTQALFIAVMGHNPSAKKGMLRPVERVSWLDAVQFCNALSRIFQFKTIYGVNQVTGKVRLKPEGNGFRLPTEAEWEAAARAGEPFEYAGSDDPNLVAWTIENAKGNTKKIRSRRVNSWGLSDMSGNVWEWCWDYYDANYYQNSPKADPFGPEQGEKRSIRGGSASSKVDRARVSARAGVAEKARDAFLGFRIVLGAIPRRS